jgi:predicted nucleic acid-binding protein
MAIVIEKIVIDTSIWIEIYRGTALGQKHLALLSKPEEIIVPTIIQYEIFKWLLRERSPDEANLAITFTGECIVQELTTELALLAAELAAEHKLHTTDAIIFATAQHHEAVLLTCDAHFKDLPSVEYFEK